MTEFKSIYVKPKSLLRQLIQKLFLKLLSKLFPKKFLSYKDKIRFAMDRSAYYLDLYVTSIYLRFRYPLYISLPVVHIYSLHMIIKFLEILKPKKIDFFLLGGCLLGAVRQESFAGRPSDIDLGIKEDQLTQLLEAIPLLIKNNARNIKLIKKKSNGKLEKLQISFRCSLIDIEIYRKVNMGTDEMWLGETGGRSDQKFNGSLFPIADLEHLMSIKAYGRIFLSPANPEIYLEKRYGENWKIHDKKQFFWNKNKSK